jgi:hypothetical protein
MMMSVEKSVECVAVETKVLGGNLPQYHFVHHKYHMTWPGLEPGQPVTNHLSYSTGPFNESDSVAFGRIVLIVAAQRILRWKCRRMFGHLSGYFGE